METNSSGEDVIIRTRKPYTIIKQRERWTAEEHNRFLEALKLYGRAWQRIEEHIGTKTAVQIRSHAQKFFSKLEKEASVKGLPIGESHEIKIPPPRPKRKPSNPYPRKLGVSAPTARDCPVSSTWPGKPVLNTESPMKGYTESEASPIRKQILKEGRSSEILALFQEAPYDSPSSESNIDNRMRGTSSASSPSSFRESMPPKSDSKDPPAGKLDTECSNIISLEVGNLVESDSSGLTIHSTGQLVPENEVDKSEKLGEPEMPQRGNITLTQGYPRHVPVHVVDMNIARSLELQSLHVTNSGSVATAKEFPSNSAPPALYPAYPILHPPFNPFQANPEALKSAAAYVTSTLPNFIISSVAHNPATHAAANIAASFWPHVMDKKACPNEALKATSNGISYADPCPNLAAVAAATVAAASAWWASHGLLPFCHPYVSFPFAVTPAATATPVTDVSPCLASDPKEERKETTLLEREPSQINETMCLAPESPPLSSDTEASACGGSENSKANATYHEPGKLLASDFQEIAKMKTRKQHDHSSCGSNTTSSSEMETDMMHEGIKALDFVHPSGDLSNKRTRSMVNNNESWKEVSEEGRLAFRALFSREVLPQSFSQKENLQSMADTKSSNEAMKQESKEMESWIEGEKNVLIGSKLKGCRTGFKPYKRCSVGAKEITVSRASDRVLKRIRIEEESDNNVIMMPVSGSPGETHCSS